MHEAQLVKRPGQRACNAGAPRCGAVAPSVAPGGTGSRSLAESGLSIWNVSRWG